MRYSREEGASTDLGEEPEPNGESPHTRCDDYCVVHRSGIGVNIGGETEDDDGECHPYASDDGARLGESAEVPWSALEVGVPPQDAGQDRDTVRDIWPENREREDGVDGRVVDGVGKAQKTQRHRAPDDEPDGSHRRASP